MSVFAMSNIVIFGENATFFKKSFLFAPKGYSDHKNTKINTTV